MKNWASESNKIIARFILEIYVDSLFKIKRDNKFSNQQLYIFNMIQNTEYCIKEFTKQCFCFVSKKYSFLNVEVRWNGGEKRGYKKNLFYLVSKHLFILNCVNSQE